MVESSNKGKFLITKNITFGNIIYLIFKISNRSVISISKLVSNFFNLRTSLFIYERSLELILKQSLQLFLLILLLTVFPTSFWIFWNVKKEYTAI